MHKKIIFFVTLFQLVVNVAEAQSLKQVVAKIEYAFVNREYPQVIIKGDSVLSTLSKTKRADQKTYALLSFFTGSAYLETGQLDKVESKLIVATEMYRELDPRSAIFSIVCNNLGSYYLRMGQYAMAVPFFTESLEVSRSLSAGFTNNLFPASMNLSAAYKGMGKYEDAVSILLDLKKILPDENPMYNLSLKSAIVSLYSDMGEFKKAESGINDILVFAEYQFGTNNSEYARTVLVASKYYYTIRDYEKAEQLIDKAILVLKKFPGADESTMPSVLTNLAYIYYFTGRIEEADSLFTQNMNWFEQRNGKEIPLYTMNCNGKALSLIGLNQNEKAIILLNEAITIQEKLKNENSVIYASLLNNLAIAYPKAGQIKLSEPALLRSLSITKQLFGEDHPEYRNVCFNLAAMYWDINRIKDAIQYYQLGMNIIKTQVKEVFSFSSEEEKLQFRNTFGIDRNKYYSFIYKEGIKELAGEVYDNNIYSKGLLLNSMKQINADIINSKDADAKQLYTDWQENKKQLAYWFSKPMQERQINIDSIKQEAEQQEKKLARISSAFQKNQQSGSTDWKAIQQQLKPDEAAIEFTEFYYFDKARFTDSILYAALVLRKDSKEPEWVTLFEEKQLDTLMEKKAINERTKVNQFYNFNPGQHSLYDLLWSAIDKKLNNVKTVYFSPVGLLNKISFASISLNEKTLLSDKYRLIQLNSTKELLEKTEQKITTKDSIILYGGIAYDADSTKLKKIAGNNESRVVNAGSGIINNSGVQSWSYLPFTRMEVEEIKKKGLEHQYYVTITSDEYATEESLKSLDGKKSPSVLHIASHGFFFPDSKGNEINKTQQVFKYAPDPLLRSGLFFAGAFYTWTKNKSIAGIEDGIATAYEIANMYLPNTKLCVLSACETGLGDLYGSEGVLGLQRAFRIAGVKNLVMSLWKVPDNETAEFMTHFYENVFKQQTIEDAFYTAQSAMKKKYRNDPYKWAAFILVR